MTEKTSNTPLTLDQSFDGQAATRNFFIGAVGHDIWASAEDQVQMVSHFGVESNFHAEQRSQLLEKGMNPIASVLKIPSGEWVGSAKEGPPHTPAPDVIDTDFAFPDQNAIQDTDFLDANWPSWAALLAKTMRSKTQTFLTQTGQAGQHCSQEGANA